MRSARAIANAERQWSQRIATPSISRSSIFMSATYSIAM
jgi:hypothetical protein